MSYNASAMILKASLQEVRKRRHKCLVSLDVFNTKENTVKKTGVWIINNKEKHFSKHLVLHSSKQSQSYRFGMT